MVQSGSTLRRILVSRGLVDPAAPWNALSGGRTNNLWRIGSGGRAIVCKLFSPNQDSPLFPNLPEAEASVLKHLWPTGMVPKFLDMQETALGLVMLYQYVEGTNWQRDVVAAGELLARLHNEAPSGLGLPRIDRDAVEKDLLSGLHPNQRIAFAEARSLPPPPPKDLVLLHGDPVPANIIVTQHRPVLIDWQCPRLGDPLDDIAVFLSPAMQTLYGGHVLSEPAIVRFLNAYGNATVAERYWKYKTYFHWRMALHCAWKMRNGSPDYAPALERELKAMQISAQPTGRSG